MTPCFLSVSKRSISCCATVCSGSAFFVVIVTANFYRSVLCIYCIVISFVVLVVQSRLSSIGRDQIEAARDLYASTAGAWFRVILPQLSTAIIAGALLAFTLSLDDFIISFFVGGPQSQTLPLFIYGSLKRGVSPQIHALSTIIFSLTLFAMLAAALKGQWKEKKLKLKKSTKELV